MAGQHVTIWYDRAGDYLEVMFERAPGVFRATTSEQVMEKVDAHGKVLGFSVLKVSALRDAPLEIAL